MRPAKPSRSAKTPPAWIGAPRPGHERLARAAQRFEDSDDFLLSPGAFAHDFYVVDLQQRGVTGVDLVRLIRRRSMAGILALSTGPHADFAAALEQGADFVIDAGAPAAHVEAAVAAVRRRILQGAGAGGENRKPWQLRESGTILQAPDGASITLSQSDQALMRCFAAAGGATVSRSAIAESLWGPGAPVMDNALHATLYRLRKRIEQAGQPLWPIYAVAGVGYEFRAALVEG